MAGFKPNQQIGRSRVVVPVTIHFYSLKELMRLVRPEQL